MLYFRYSFTCYILTVTLSAVTSSASNTTKSPLHLLALVPLTETSYDASLSCVNRGEELLPAAQIAADLVNANLLADFDLQIVPVKTAKCSDDSFSLTLANFVQQVTKKSLTVVGVVGMMCSAAVLSVSPLASHTGIDILQITSGTVSPTSIAKARVRVRVNRLFQTAPPSTIFNDALLALIENNDITQLAVMRHIGTFFIEHDVIANDLREKVVRKHFNVNITDFEISEFDNIQFVIPSIVNTVASSDIGIHVIYATVTVEEARLLLCTSVRRDTQIIYPRNQWIFHSHSFKDLVQPIDNCSRSDMENALEGVILLQYPERSKRSSTDILSWTNYTYNDYLHRYKQELASNLTACTESPGVIHTNALFDSVIAFGLAINRSLQTVNNKELTKYGIRSNFTSEITNVLQSELENLTFLGASGSVQFNNMTHEVTRITNVDILIVQNKTAVVQTRQPFVPGTFNTTTDSIPLGLPIAAIVLVWVLVMAHTVILLLFFKYWNSPDIKATSPVLSVVIIIACYMLDFSVLITAVRYGFALEHVSDQAYVACCTLENWLLFIGIQLIFATLLMRLVRVYRLFFHYTKASKIWTDYGLLMFITLLVSGGVLILTVWTAVDTFERFEDRNFIASTDMPYFVVKVYCQSRYFEQFPVWVGLLLAYTGVMMVIMILLAIRTRKIIMESFKDTLTVNVFIYTTVICFVFFIVVSLIFDALKDQVVTFVFQVLALSSVAIACACFLFLPKIYAAWYDRKYPQRRMSSAANLAMYANKAVMTTTDL